MQTISTRPKKVYNQELIEFYVSLCEVVPGHIVDNVTVNLWYNTLFDQVAAVKAHKQNYILSMT